VRNGVATVVVGGLVRHDRRRNAVSRVNRARQSTRTIPRKCGSWATQSSAVGWRDTRVVGDVLYAVSEEYGWAYGYYGPRRRRLLARPDTAGDKMVVSSVSFAGRTDPGEGTLRSARLRRGSSNVTPDAILFAHDVLPPDA